MAEITVEIADTDFDFDVTDEDYNQYLNEMSPDNKVNPAFNFLSRTVKEDQKKDFKALVVNNGTVKGVVVLQVASVIVEDYMNSGITVSVKKPKKSQKE